MPTTETRRANPYRIKDLVQKTGITKETIHFYITEGLLPKARKTSRNMAWYGDEHVERLQRIRELQEKQFLPLKAIKAVLNEARDFTFSPEQQRTIEAIQRQLRQRRDGAESQLTALKEAQGRLHIVDEEVSQLEKAGLLEVDRAGAAPQIATADEPLLAIWADLRDLGFNPENGFTAANLEMFENIAALLLDQEVKLVTLRFESLPGDQAARMIEEAVPEINELLGVLHARMVRRFILNFKPGT